MKLDSTADSKTTESADFQQPISMEEQFHKLHTAIAFWSSKDTKERSQKQIEKHIKEMIKTESLHDLKNIHFPAMTGYKSHTFVKSTRLSVSQYAKLLIINQSYPELVDEAINRLFDEIVIKSQSSD